MNSGDGSLVRLNDIIMLGLSVGLLLLGWTTGTMLKLSLGLLVRLSLGTKLILILGVRLAWRWKKAPDMAGEEQIAHYGPTATDVGPEVLAQAVPVKAF